MKKKLFAYGIYMLGISSVISALIVICTSSLLLASKDIKYKNGVVESEVIVMRDGKQVYATHNYSEIQLQNILLTAKNGSLTYRENGVSYRVSQQTYKDGAILLRLSPVIDFGYAEKLIFVLYAASFIIIYILVLLLVLRRIGRGIVQPLETLTEHTRLLASGSLDENIPDEGVSEINALGKEIETLRLRLKKEVYQNKKSADSRKFLISSMSHDLRTPITSLHGYLEGIIDGVADSEEKRGLYVRKALEKVDLINRMIGDLLLYSKLDQNQIEFHCTYVDIAKYLEAFMLDSKLYFSRGQKKITFENELQANYSVYIDVSQFDRVMNNITSNAYKYIPEKTGLVRIMLRENSSGVIIEVHDNGSGISAEDLPKIFDRFYRCEKSRQIKGSSGLGLAISKQIVENMNGRIWAVSKEGAGTSIMITFKKHLTKGAEADGSRNEENTDN